MDIGVWLRGLGLGEYEAAFLENKIEADVLPELTDSDLGQLGMPMGHRKRLLKAIAALNASSVATATPVTAPAPLLPDAGERRQLTVMFCDLVLGGAAAVQVAPRVLAPSGGVAAAYTEGLRISR